jgi:spermidine synthase
MLVLDGIVQTTSLDGYIYNEMISHIPCCIHPDPRRILIIGGGDCGAAREVCKYPNVEHLDLVEIDETVVKACQKHLPEISGHLADPRVQFIFEDGVKFVKDRSQEYDIIIVDSSDPIGPAKALFEKEFYESLFEALKSNGLMVCQSQSPVFHEEVMTQTYQKIKSLFKETWVYTAVVPTYPGGLWSFTIGAKQKINIDPARLKGPTRYVNKQIMKHCFCLPEFMLQQLGIN